MAVTTTTTTTNTLTSNERHPKRFFCCRPGYGRMPSAESGESSSSTNTASTSSSSSSSINSSIVHLSMPEEIEGKMKKNSSSSSSSSSLASSSSQTSSRSKSPTPSTILSAILAKQRRKHHKPNSLNTIICCPSSLSKTVSAISEIDNFERIQLNNSAEKEEEKIKKEGRGNGLFKKFGNIQKKFILNFNGKGKNNEKYKKGEKMKDF